MKQRIGSPQLTAQETQLIRQLRQQPAMAARGQVILDLAHAAEGPLQTADEIEALLIQELRQLGCTTMNQWATQVEQRVSAQRQSQDATVRSRKKTLTWWCVFGVVTVDDRIWRSESKSYFRPLPARLGVTPRGRSRRLERVLTDFGVEHSLPATGIFSSARSHWKFTRATSRRSRSTAKPSAHGS